MKHISLDPRVNRVDLPQNDSPYQGEERNQWQTYEVFQQMKRGDQHVHVGAVHAPNGELALVLAKEQFGRREKCANLWVVKTKDVFMTSYEDADMFEHSFDKNYREGDGYKVKVTVESFKKELDALLGTSQNKMTSSTPKTTNSKFEELILPSLDGKPERKILIKK